MRVVQEYVLHHFHIKLNLETHDVDLSTDILLEVC